MYLIVKRKGGHQAIPIKNGDKWELGKVLAGQREVRIALRIRGHRWLLYSTRAVSAKYPTLGRDQLMALCDEIIATASVCIQEKQECIDFGRIAGVAECCHLRRWRVAGLVSPVPLEYYHGHSIDPQTEQLMLDMHDDPLGIIRMDHEPPGDGQEALPY